MVFRLTHGGTTQTTKTTGKKARESVHWEENIQPEEELLSLLESTKHRVECLRETVNAHTQEIEDDLAAMIEPRDFEHKEAKDNKEAS